MSQETFRKQSSICAVIVTYQPDLAVLNDLLRALTPQVQRSIIVDNGSTPELISGLRELISKYALEATFLATNMGIAHAQNIGIQQAMNFGDDFILLSDQDSLPTDHMVKTLLAGFYKALERGENVAAVGPITIDERNSGTTLLWENTRWGPRRIDHPEQVGDLVEAAFLIASGCLIEMQALKKIGSMRGEWFIDHIDLEWGLRARANGFKLFGVSAAHLHHSLGDTTRDIPGRSRGIHIHSPIRNYYMTRNTLFLIGSPLFSFGWKVNYVLWVTKYTLYYMVAVHPRWKRTRLLWRGILDAFRKKTGPLRKAI